MDSRTLLKSEPARASKERGLAVVVTSKSKQHSAQRFPALLCIAAPFTFGAALTALA